MNQFGADHRRRFVGVTVCIPPTLTRPVEAGEELLMDYGNDFCKSLHTMVDLRFSADQPVGKDNRRW
jgi:hypothetical protein